MQNKRHSWLTRAILFSGLTAFCAAPVFAQQHDDKDGHGKTEHVQKDHNGDKGHEGKGGPAGGHNAGPGGDHMNGGHKDGGHGGPVGAALHAVAPHGGPGGAPDRVHGGPHFSYRGHSFEPFRGPAFNWPHGHAYHRPHVGWDLPLLFLTTEYILGNYGMYGLEPPPPGADWVRYGPDILLVDRHSGRVIQVIHGAFVN